MPAIAWENWSPVSLSNRFDTVAAPVTPVLSSWTWHGSGTGHAGSDYGQTKSLGQKGRPLTESTQIRIGPAQQGQICQRQSVSAFSKKCPPEKKSPISRFCSQHTDNFNSILHLTKKQGPIILFIKKKSRRKIFFYHGEIWFWKNIFEIFENIFEKSKKSFSRKNISYIKNFGKF